MKSAIKKADMERLAQYREELDERPRLVYLFFELTDACNLSCMHCGSSSSPHKRTYLSYENVNKVLESVAEKYNPQKIMVCLTGGEPMLHSDFFKIASRVTKLGFMCGITTNGTLISRDAAEKIRESGICSVTFSLDGIRETHDWFRSLPGAFDKTLAGIKNLIEVTEGKITTQITTVVHEKNIAELEQIYEIVLKTQVDSWRVINLDPIGRALENEELLLDSEEFRYILEYIREKRYSSKVSIDVTYGCAHYLGVEYEREVRDNYFVCGSGVYVGSVLCNGDIYSCLDIERRAELIQGNIEKDDFVDVWEHRFKEFRRDRTKLCTECVECDERRFCRGDAEHTWNFEKNEPLICMKKILGGEKNESMG